MKKQGSRKRVENQQSKDDCPTPTNPRTFPARRSPGLNTIPTLLPISKIYLRARKKMPFLFNSSYFSDISTIIKSIPFRRKRRKRSSSLSHKEMLFTTYLEPSLSSKVSQDNVLQEVTTRNLKDHTGVQMLTCNSPIGCWCHQRLIVKRK